MIEGNEVWDVVSPKEKTFLLDPSPGDWECVLAVRRLESIWTMLWALGYIDELEWPTSQCDVAKMLEITDQIAEEPDFARPTELHRLPSFSTSWI